MEKTAAEQAAGWKRLCIGMVLLQSVIYGVLDPLTKVVYQSISVYSFLTVRYLLATVFMLLFWGKTVWREVRQTPVRQYLAPCLCMATAFVVSNMALQYAAATNVAFLRSLSALIAPVLLLLFYHKKYRLKGVLLQVAMLLGLYLLCAKGGLSGFGLGEVCALVSAALAAGALVFGEDSLRHVSAVTLSCVQAACAIVICGVMGLATGALQTARWDLLAAPANLGVLVYAALGCTVGGYLLQNVALRHVPSKLVAVLQCTYPVMTAVMSFFILRERLSVSGIVGALIILACVCLESLQSE